MINIYLCLCANIIFSDGSVKNKFICKSQEAFFPLITSSEIGSPCQHNSCPEGPTGTRVPPACPLRHPQLHSLVLTLVISWAVIAGCSTSKVHVPKKTGESGLRQGRTGTCFSQEGKPPPPSDFHLPLTDHLQLEDRDQVCSFLASMTEPGKRWEKKKLGTVNQVFQTRTNLSHIIISAYFLKSCEHVLMDVVPPIFSEHCNHIYL